MPSHQTKLINQKEMALFPKLGEPLSEISYPHPDNVNLPDVIWVFRVESPGKAYLIGRLIVGERLKLPVSRKAAVLRATPGSEEPVKDISLMKAGVQLEFTESGGHVFGIAFTESGGQVNIKGSFQRCIQSGREITPASAEILERVWRSEPGET